LKLCNCGACHTTLRSETIARRIVYWLRSVPLCAGCSRRDEAWIGERLAGYGATAGDERKG
jgi:hypothetical protein